MDQTPANPPRPRRKRRSTSFDVTRVAPVDRAGDDPVITDLVHSRLREAILEGAIPVGGIISQVELSQHLGVSRTPLREAIRRLEQEGLVEATPKRRARVRSFDANDLEFVYANRILLESLAITVTVPALTPADLVSLEQGLKEMADAAGREDFTAWEAAHRHFHRALLAHASAQLFDEIEHLAARSVLAANREPYLITVSQGFHAGPEEHEAIVEACREKDASGAAVLLARHLSVLALAVVTHVMPEHDPVNVRAALRLIAGADARA